MDGNDCMKLPLTMAVIAGGKSTRFGRDKGLALVKNRSLIDYTLQTARQLSDTIILIYGKEVLYGGLNIPIFFDVFPDCGPLGGVHSALIHASTEWIATMPCDMPLLIPDIYHILYGLRQLNRPVVAVSHRGIEPLVSIWHRSAAVEIEKALRKKRFSMQESIFSLKATTVLLPAVMKDYREYYFTNVNYPEDLTEIENYLDEK